MDDTTNLIITTSQDYVINNSLMLRTSLKRCNNLLSRSVNILRFISTIDDRSVRIGDVTVSSAPCGSGRPDLIPKLELKSQYNNLHETLPPCHLSHLRWMLQKDLMLHQDFVLLGSPELARDRRHLIFLYATLLDREVEYMTISRDTSDADLKQRKEVSSSGTQYVNQAPVRAALNGRLLILDGLEKAERNVLPTLNNLLENRELSLDDGSMLVSPSVYDVHNNDESRANDDSGLKIHRVHPDFRVAALGSLLEGESATLDPPLRSRFQARLTRTVPVSSMLEAASMESNGFLDTATFKDLVQLAAEVPHFSLQSMHDAVRYFEKYEKSFTPKTVLSANGISFERDMVGVEDVMSTLKLKTDQKNRERFPGFVETKTTGIIKDLIIAGFESGRRAVALVGAKGCYKSALVRETARGCGAQLELFTLYSDLTSRDLLQFRGTDAESGNTIWRDSPLSRAVQKGKWVILDGIDKLRTDTLSSIALLMEHGFVDLPDGRRIYAHQDFRCIALAHPSNVKQWIAPEILSMFYWVKVDPLPSDELEDVLIDLYPSLPRKVVGTIVNLRDQLDHAISEGAADTSKEKESLILSLRKMKHICRRLEQREDNKLARLCHNTLMTDFMPDRERRIVIACMTKCGIIEGENVRGQIHNYCLDNELIKQCRRIPSNPLLVPNPQFEENNGQLRVMGGILEAHSVGEKALLITGYQGVGKNRIVDYLLSTLCCEREYLQLHRDTTIQSLLSTPSVEDGRIVFHDSPLVRAAKHGQILVLDEADKAPVEVVALLKGLIEDGELALPDGSILRYNNRDEPDCVEIHPDFRIWAIANPSGYPFHGNDLAREMADVFSCHNVPPMDIESHERILKSYGPNVGNETIQIILQIWEDLRISHEKGEIVYPYSIRESASVVKHLNAFPADGLEDTLENILAFDRLDRGLEHQLGIMFAKHGITISKREVASSPIRRVDGISTPKTRSSSPKYGKTDPNNSPHVGGNTWAGGTGGSDTAGLGGRGGPFRLDAGHPVHQISEEMKAEVSREAQRRAKKMAEDALNQRLKELDMGKLDWDKYDSLRCRVEVQVQQLRNYLKDLNRKTDERVWIKRQTSGELDDSRLVDAISGEKDVFKRRGNAAPSNYPFLLSDPMSIKLVVDISASMYRFNGYDGRLERLLEASVMIMEGLRDDKRFKIDIIGHNGSSAKIELLNPNISLDEATQLKIMECMVANTQYTYAGDNTVNAINSAVAEADEGSLVLVISDANLERYRIRPEDLDSLQNRKVNAHLILIGSFGDEALSLVSSIPNERAHVCFQTSELPVILKKLVTSSLVS